MVKRKSLSTTFKKSSKTNSISLSPPKKSKHEFLKNSIRKANPDIFHFTKESAFIYEPTHSNHYFQKLTNKNCIKPTKMEVNKLNEIISNQKFFEENDNIFVLPSFKFLMENVKKASPILDERDLIIKDIINSFPKDKNISVQKVTNKYNSIAESKGIKKLGKSMIHLIMRKKLQLHFKLKTIKNKKLIESDFIRYTFFFLKVFNRGISLGLNFIFLDESGIFLYNNNYKNWVENNEEIYYNSGKNKKLNLFLAVSPEKIIHHKFEKENTTSITFKNFFLEMLEKIGKNELQKYIFILDNCTSHLTYDLFKIYQDSKLKVLFNVPYLSNFNMVENMFRLVKNRTYKKLYNDLNILIEDIENIFKEEKTIISLKKLYIETLREYFNFINKYKYFNFN